MTQQHTTQLLQPNESAIELAAQLIKDGNVVGIPTETVYGLAANALDESAVKKIFAAKNRPCDNPLIAHISDMDMMKFLCDEVPKNALLLAKAFWPGPLTFVIKRGGTVCNAMCANLDTIAVRMPSHNVALSIINCAGVPLGAPSANVSGRPSPTAAAHVMLDMQGKIPLVIDGGECKVGLESTVVSLAEETPIILRPGVITKAQIESVLNENVLLADSITSPTETGEKVLSPGMKYKHYAPNAEMVLIKGNKQQFCTYVNTKVTNEHGSFALCFDGEEQMLQCPCIAFGKQNNESCLAKNLFAALRDLDEKKAQKIYAHCPAENGVGLAVYNRMLRAAAFKVVNLNE